MHCWLAYKTCRSNPTWKYSRLKSPWYNVVRFLNLGLLLRVLFKIGFLCIQSGFQLEVTQINPIHNQKGVSLQPYPEAWPWCMWFISLFSGIKLLQSLYFRTSARNSLVVSQKPCAYEGVTYKDDFLWYEHNNVCFAETHIKLLCSLDSRSPAKPLPHIWQTACQRGEFRSNKYRQGMVESWSDQKQCFSFIKTQWYSHKQYIHSHTLTLKCYINTAGIRFGR